jgi:hypothetical protein
MKVVETMGNEALNPDRIVFECKCGVVVSTRYDPRDYNISEKKLTSLFTWK